MESAEPAHSTSSRRRPLSGCTRSDSEAQGLQPLGVFMDSGSRTKSRMSADSHALSLSWNGPVSPRSLGDVHTSLTTYARDQLRPQMPADLRVRVEEYVGLEIEEDEEDLSRQKPDVLVTENWASAGQTAVAVAEAVVADEPLVVTTPGAETLRRVLIQDRRGDRLVTAIEFLSPGNKYGEALIHFRKKQRELLSGGVNLVEIDLIRGGGWTVFPPEAAIPGRMQTLIAWLWCGRFGRRSSNATPPGFVNACHVIRIPLRPVIAMQFLICNCSSTRLGKTRLQRYRLCPWSAAEIRSQRCGMDSGATRPAGNC